MAIFKKDKKQTPPPSPTVFNEAPPMTGGNSFTVKELIKAREDLINVDFGKVADGSTLAEISDIINKELGYETKSNTYNFWFLLNFMADYFTNLVDFKFEDVNIQRAVMVTIRLGIIYGHSCFYKLDDKVAGLYINNLELDEMGYPSKMEYLLGNNVLLSQDTFDPVKYSDCMITKPVDDNMYIFMPYNYRLGGLVTWRPFINAMQKLLEMLYVNAFQYHKVFSYKCLDPSVAKNELKLLLDRNNPVLVSVGNRDNLLTNKLEMLELDSSGTNGLVEFIKEYQKFYFDMFGKRQNTDRKNERNIAGEVDATQNTYDTLQRELTNNIKFLLENVKKMTGCNYELNEPQLTKDEEHEEDNNEDQDNAV